MIHVYSCVVNRYPYHAENATKRRSSLDSAPHLHQNTPEGRPATIVFETPALIIQTVPHCPFECYRRSGMFVTDYKRDGVSWLQAMERLYERPSKLQDLFDHAHCSPQLLLEALETAVLQQPFIIYVDRFEAQNCPHACYQNSRSAIQK